jgi:acyl-CoA reductase-like NAD-dependent aldehyde dehydrogenase
MNAYPMLINGQLVHTAEHDPVIDPAEGAAFATCARATPEHVDAAMAAAAHAFQSWRKDDTVRREALAACAAAIRARLNDFAALLSREQGKPLSAATGEALGASVWFSYFAKLPLEPEVLLDDEKKRIEVLRKPLGVVAAITPWNFPLILLTWKLAPAFLAGNTVVAKPSPYTPLTSLLLAETLREILPPGVLNVLSGGNELGAQIASHPQVRKISFTGSVATGKTIMAVAAADLKRVTLELGGNDPAIVLDDVDPEQILDGLFWGAFQNSGQVCTAIKRLYVHERVYAPIRAGLIARARTVKVGRGSDPDTQLGPINNAMQLDKLTELVDDAKRGGATIETGGDRLPGAGYFYPPTIVTGAHAGMRLVDEEQFGTALPLIVYRNLDDALAQANRTHYGLGASVWSADPARAAAVVQEIESGTGWVNHHLDVTPFAPFGGAKWSGVGYENGRWGYNEFTAMQVINIRK